MVASEEHADAARFDAQVSAPVYLTRDVEGIGGRIKERDEDFIVDEVPLYQPSGRGEHIYLYVEKRGLSTIQLRDELARHFRVRPQAIGHAGLKDKHAITRQVMSIHTPGKRPEDFPSFDHPRIKILWIDLHENKLQRGHLAGNRFSIKVRGVEATAALRAQKALDMLARVGLPNRFGVQRFGYLRNNHLVGRAMILGDARGAMDHLLGSGAVMPKLQRDSRLAYDEGDYGSAFHLMPKVFKGERQALRVLADGGDHAAALMAIDATAAGFFISSFQSAIFNGVLNRRVTEGTLDRLVEGDVAFVIKSRAVFDVRAETLAEPDLAARLGRFEVAPSGPMWGTTMKRASGAIDHAELGALEDVGVTVEDLHACEARDGYLMIGGDRRPLRIPVMGPEVEGGLDEHGSYVRCAFELPRGSFATTVMDEVMKAPLEEELADE